jgi:hypothetical protein
MPLYEEEELLVIVRDACDIVMKQITDEIAPKHPEFDDVQAMMDILIAIKELPTSYDIQANMLRVAQAVLMASSCNCEDADGRHAFMGDAFSAFAEAGNHVCDTIKGRMVREYVMNNLEAHIVFTGMQFGIFKSSDEALSAYEKRTTPLIEEKITIPDYVPEDIT